MRSRREKKRKSHREAVSAELELMPMLNVFITIIPLLLLSAAFVPVSVIKTTLPSSDAQPAEATESEKVDVSVYIRPDAYLIEFNGKITNTIARSGDAADASEAGQAELTEVLKEIAAAHPDHHDVTIYSLPTTRYEEIVQVMDISRAAGMPEASLAEMNTGI
jgi:biopolymer transport protein ExbD